MSGFAGSYDHTIDAKGRIIVPVPFREELGENFTIGLNGQANTIAIYPQDAWETINQRLDRISDTDELGNFYKRFILGNAFPNNTLDAQGRILLPAKLRTKFNLEKDVVLTGMTRCIEIWPTEAYEQQESSTMVDMKAILQHMEEKY